MLDPNNYTAAGTFDGFRFVGDGPSRTLKSGELEPKNTIREEGEEARTKFTDVDWKFPFWGASKRAWYVFLPLESAFAFSPLSVCSHLQPTFLFPPLFHFTLPSANTVSQPSPLVRLPLTKKHACASAPELRHRAREPGGEASVLVDDRHRTTERSEIEVEEAGKGRDLKGR